MSLKAKLEAVIYASEEPVTLQQLTGVLGQEAQAELEAAQARQGQLALEPEQRRDSPGEEAGDLDALNAETLGSDHIAARVDPRQATSDDPSPLVLPATPAKTVPASAAGIAAAEGGGEAEREVAGAAAIAAQLGSAYLPAELSPAELRTRERRLREYMRSLLDELIADYAGGDRGLEIREVAGGFRFATKPEYHDAVRGFVRSLKPPLKLSLQALETLAVVAYKQPVTAPEVSEIRGVDSGGVLGSLITRKLIATAGRKQVIGRPILYKTTKEFLLRFGLKDVNELPSIEEFERLAADLNEAVQEEIPMPQDTQVPVATTATTGGLSTAEVERDVEPSRDVHDAQADGIPADAETKTEETDAEETSAEALSSAPDGPGEFTGNSAVPSADNVAIDGRVAGVPSMYDEPNDEMLDSPAHDAATESAEKKGE